MKNEKNILIAFVLNLGFSIFEFIGGIITGSIAILSDAVHDVSDAVSIGLSLILERKSKKAPDEKYTYGYARYSVLASAISTIVLIVGSCIVSYKAIFRIANPTNVDYNGMIVFAIIGVAVNFLSAFFTRHGKSLNQRAVNLHMLEDVLGWLVVLVGALVMKFTEFYLVDPIMSIIVSVFVLVNASKMLFDATSLFLEKTPRNIKIDEIKSHICKIEGIVDVHHIHIWSIDGQNNYATMHIVTKTGQMVSKKQIRDELKYIKISHATIELEDECEICSEKTCQIEPVNHHAHHHHH